MFSNTVNAKKITNTYINNTGTTVTEGDAVVFDSSEGSEYVKFPTSIGEIFVIGVVSERALNGQKVDISIFGLTNIKVDNSNGNIAADDYLIVKGDGTGTCVKYTVGNAFSVVAIARESYTSATAGLIEAQVIGIQSSFYVAEIDGTSSYTFTIGNTTSNVGTTNFEYRYGVQTVPVLTRWNSTDEELEIVATKHYLDSNKVFTSNPSNSTYYPFYFNSTLSATGAITVANTTLSAVRISGPVITTDTGQTFSGTSIYSLYISGPSTVGGGSVSYTNGYGAYIAAPTIGATNRYTLYLAAPSGASTKNYSLGVANTMIIEHGSYYGKFTVAHVGGLTIDCNMASMTLTAGDLFLPALTTIGSFLIASISATTTSLGSGKTFFAYGGVSTEVYNHEFTGTVGISGQYIYGTHANGLEIQVTTASKPLTLTPGSGGKIETTAQVKAGGYEVGANVGVTNTYTGISSITVNGGIVTSVATSGTTLGLHTVYVPANAMFPRTTTGVSAATYTEVNASGPNFPTLTFDPDTEAFAQFTVGMPKSWNGGTLTFKFIWSVGAGATAYDAVWKVSAACLIDGDSLSASFGTAKTVTDAGTVADKLYLSAATDALTPSGTPSTTGETYLTVQVSRDATNLADTLDVDARLHGLIMLYTTDAENDS